MNRRRLSDKARAEIIARQCGLCHCGCGKSLDGERVEFDHQVPLALGGSDTPDNMHALIRACHAAKTRDDVRRISKAKRQQLYHETGKSHRHATRPIRSRGFTGWRKFNGEVVRT